MTAFNDLVQANAPNFANTFGTVLAENEPPTVGLGPIPANGTEGAPIAFSVVGTGPGGSFDNCDATGARLSSKWSFDDNGQGFGLSVNHTFADNLAGGAPHSGQVVVTDVAGNATTLQFSVPVANVPPTVNAGPSKTSDWGLPVAFHANGSDQGPVDNLSLQYSWNFNDPASPVGAAGQDVSHTFDQPGIYNVVVTAVDNDGATGTGTVQVTINKRTTSTAYTGPTQALPSKYVTLTAQLTDNHGQAVVGRTITFKLGPLPAVTATANGSGIASASVLVKLSPATYNLAVSYAGDGQYVGSTTSTSFKVGR